MLTQNDFIKELAQNFFLKEQLSLKEQVYLQELIPLETIKPLSIEEYINLFNEIASFYTGELARLIKNYLLLNDLLSKDNARIIKEQVMFFRRFFHYLLEEINKIDIHEATLDRLHYVLLKIDKYIKKYAPYLNM